MKCEGIYNPSSNYSLKLNLIVKELDRVIIISLNLYEINRKYFFHEIKNEQNFSSNAIKF